MAEEGVEIRISKRRGKSIREIVSGASPYRDDGADNRLTGILQKTSNCDANLIQVRAGLHPENSTNLR